MLYNLETVSRQAAPTLTQYRILVTAESIVFLILKAYLEYNAAKVKATEASIGYS